MITIVDYGVGNFGSVLNMFRHIGIESEITSDISVLKRAKKLCLPGVGGFDTAMARLNKKTDLRKVLDDMVLNKKIPVLGVCLGMQLLMESSEEGQKEGLGWIPGVVKRFPINLGVRVPHMGWNTISFTRDSKLTVNIDQQSKYYFVHSYYVKVRNKKDSITKSYHGLEFDSAISKNNIYGVQFHPEKSHRYGMEVFKNFSKI
jgi:glutamine amidotransferase